MDPRQKQEVAGAIPAAAGGTTELHLPPPAVRAEPGQKEKEKAGGEPEPLPVPVARNVEEKQALRAKKWNAELDEDEPELLQEVVKPRNPDARRKKVVEPEVVDDEVEEEEEEEVIVRPRKGDRKIKEVEADDEDAEIDFGDSDEE